METSVPKKRTPDKTDAADAHATGTKLTYRELRNTPGRVWERLAAGTPLTLMADGQAQALLIPIQNGDADEALDAYVRGRAMLAVARIRENARKNGTSKMTLAQINALIKEVREERKRQAAEG